MDTLQSVEFGAPGVMLKKSLMKHLLARIGVFESRKIGRGSIVMFIVDKSLVY